MTILRDHSDEVHEEEYRVVVSDIAGLARVATGAEMIDAVMGQLVAYADAVGAGDEAGIITVLDLINAVVSARARWCGIVFHARMFDSGGSVLLLAYLLERMRVVFDLVVNYMRVFMCLSGCN